MPHPSITATAALLTLWQNNPGLAKVMILQGPPVADVDDSDVLAVGLSVESFVPAQGTERVGWGGQRHHSFDIRCFVQSWSGDTEMEPRIERAFELFELCAADVRANPTLSGAVERAQVGLWRFRPAESRSGASALVEFTIRVNARSFD